MNARAIAKGRVHLSCAALLCGCALSGLAPAFALAAESAPHWQVNKVQITTAEKFKAVSTSEVTLSTAELELEDAAGECTAEGEIVGGGPGTDRNVVLTCQNVKVVGGGACVINGNNTVTTNTLASTLVWLKKEGGEAGDLLKPAASETFAELEISGCGLAGNYPVRGEVIGSFTPVENEVEVGTVTLPASPIVHWWTNAEPRVEQGISHLKAKALNATLVGTFSMELNPREPFGIFPAIRTKLCEEMKSPCPAGKIREPIAFKASAEVPAQEAITLELETAKMEVKATVSCDKSTFEAETKEKEGAPLNASLKSVGFQECSVVGAGKCSEVKMTNVPVNATIQALGAPQGSGAMTAAVVFRVICEGEAGKPIDCEYRSGTFQLDLLGAETGAVEPMNTTVPKSAFVGEANCQEDLVWNGKYAISSFHPFWVTT